MKKILYMALMAMMFASCDKEMIENETQSGEVSFSAVIVQTRATDATWALGDRIGVFIENEIGTVANNVQYKIDDITSGAMSPVDSTFKVLLTDNTMIYHAYHPYRDSIVGQTLKIDVTDQSNLPAIDLIKCSMLSRGETNVRFEFQHILAKLSFDISADGMGVSDLTGLSATLTGAFAKYDFEMNALSRPHSFIKADIPLVVKATPTAATIEALVIPMDDLTGCEIIFAVGGKKFTWTPPVGESWYGGFNHVYAIEKKGYTYDSGTKTYTVTTVRGLKNVIEEINSNTDNFDRNITLTAGATYDMSTVYKNGSNGKPNFISLVGLAKYYAPDMYAYTGTFDGNHATIKNFYQISDENNQGQGGFIKFLGENGNVKNLHFENATVMCNDGPLSVNYSGVVVSYNNGTISNCAVLSGGVKSSNVDVYATTTVGGLVGRNSGKIVACHSAANVFGTESNTAGGITGENWGEIIACYSTGTVESPFCAGGVVGLSIDAVLATNYWVGSGINAVGENNHSVVENTEVLASVADLNGKVTQLNAALRKMDPTFPYHFVAGTGSASPTLVVGAP